MAIDAWYVVKSGGLAAAGTDAGRYTTKPTGTFTTLGTAGYYDNILDALNAATPPTKDSIGFVSHLHDFQAVGVLNLSVIVAPYPPMFISVNDAAMESSLVGAIERAADNNDFLFNTVGGALYLHGITIFVGDDVLVQGSNSYLKIENGGISFLGVSDKMQITSDGIYVEFINTEVSWPAGTTVQFIQLSNGCKFVMTGGSVSGGSGTITDLVGGTSAVNAGFTAEFNGVGLSDVIGYLLADTGELTTADDSINMSVDGCKLNAGLTGFVQERFKSENQRMRVTNSSAVAAEAEYQDFESTWVGDVESVNSSEIVRTESVTFESGEQTSLKITTTSDCSIAHPLTFELGGRFVKLSSTSTMTIYFAVINTVTLTDANFFAEIINPNGAAANVFDYSTNRNSDIISAGVEWTDDSGSAAWKNNGVDLTGYNEYKMDIPITGGGDGYPIVRLRLTEPSLAGTMFVSKVMDAS